MTNDEAIDYPKYKSILTYLKQRKNDTRQFKKNKMLNLH